MIGKVLYKDTDGNGYDINIIEDGRVTLSNVKIKRIKEDGGNLKFELGGDGNDINLAVFDFNDMLDEYSTYKKRIPNLVGNDVEDKDMKEYDMREKDVRVESIVIMDKNNVYVIRKSNFPQFYSKIGEESVYVREYYKLVTDNEMGNSNQHENYSNIVQGKGYWIDKKVGLNLKVEEVTDNDVRYKNWFKYKAKKIDGNIKLRVTLIDVLLNLYTKGNLRVVKSEYNFEEIGYYLTVEDKEDKVNIRKVELGMYKKEKGYTPRGRTYRGIGGNGEKERIDVEEIIKWVLGKSTVEIEIVYNLLYSLEDLWETLMLDNTLKGIVDALEVAYNLDKDKGWGILAETDINYREKVEKIVRGYEKEEINQIQIEYGKNMTIEEYMEYIGMDKDDFARRVSNVRNKRTHENRDLKTYQYGYNDVIIAMTLLEYYVMDIMKEEGLDPVKIGEEESQ